MFFVFDPHAAQNLNLKSQCAWACEQVCPTQTVISSAIGKRIFLRGCSTKTRRILQPVRIGDPHSRRSALKAIRTAVNTSHAGWTECSSDRPSVHRMDRVFIGQTGTHGLSNTLPFWSIWKSKHIFFRNQS